MSFSFCRSKLSVSAPHQMARACIPTISRTSSITCLSSSCLPAAGPARSLGLMFYMSTLVCQLVDCPPPHVKKCFQEHGDASNRRDPSCLGNRQPAPRASLEPDVQRDRQPAEMRHVAHFFDFIRKPPLLFQRLYLASVGFDHGGILYGRSASLASGPEFTGCVRGCHIYGDTIVRGQVQGDGGCCERAGGAADQIARLPGGVVDARAGFGAGRPPRTRTISNVPNAEEALFWGV